jgi:Na+/citrate or Na+/malate symporter
VVAPLIPAKYPIICASVLNELKDEKKNVKGNGKTK